MRPRSEIKAGDAVKFIGFTDQGWANPDIFFVVKETLGDGRHLLMESHAVTHIHRRQVTHIKRKKKKVQPRFVGFTKPNVNGLMHDSVYNILTAKNCAVFIIEEKDLTPELREKYNIKE